MTPPTSSGQKAPKILDIPIGLKARGLRKEFDSLGTVMVPADHYWGAQTQRSLVHFDIGNFFVDGERMGMLDFQAPHWSKGIRDVNYFLVNSLPAGLLARHERELLGCYVEALRARGVALGAEEAWAQYRGFSFQTLMTIVTSLGLGPLTERDALMEEVLARAAAAVERTGFDDWLDALPRTAR